MPRVVSRGILVAVVVGMVLTVATAAVAGHSVGFTTDEVPAATEVTLELRVPEAGSDHNPEGTQDHHTTQVRVSVPEAFEGLGCIPPDGWDCARTGELYRFFKEEDQLLQRPQSFTLGLYLQTPSSNGRWGFRTIQVYNDGHETRFTVEGGTAPSVEVTGATPPSPAPASPSPSPTPAPAPSPTPTPQPADASSPAAPTDPATPSPVPTPSPPSQPSPDDAASPTATAPRPSPEGNGEARPSPAPSPAPEQVAAASSQPPPGGLGALERAALSLVVVAGGWAVVEHRARRRRSDH